ncbi:MAG: alpha/beta hydrolase [Thermoguttaceae bacterium]
MRSLIAVSLIMYACTNAICANVQSDIEYGKAGDESLLLDACVPDGAGPFPIAIIVHGGGWSGGDKTRDISLLFKPLTDANFTWFSINYRLAPKHRYPACIEDVEQAIRWVKKHAAQYKGDPQQIALIGESAGGHLVCLAAARAKDDTRVAAVVGFAAPTDLEADALRRGNVSASFKNVFNRENLDETTRDMLRDASPITYLKADMPPFLLIHGTDDKSVLYSQSVIFQKRLKELGVPCEIITIEKGAHGMKNWEKLDTSYKEKLIAWLNSTLAAEKH